MTPLTKVPKVEWGSPGLGGGGTGSRFMETVSILQYEKFCRWTAVTVAQKVNALNATECNEIGWTRPWIFSQGTQEAGLSRLAGVVKRP